MTSGTILARDMVNEPANTMTPSRMAEIASGLGNMGNLEVSILDRTEMETLGMGALLGVAKGSTQPPKLISLKYNAKQVNIVASNNSELEIFVDGNSIPKYMTGSDLTTESKIFVSEPRLYNIINSDDTEPHELIIKINGSGFEIFTFTFG